MKKKLDLNNFEDRLEYGKEAEDEIYNFLLRKGWSLIPTQPFKSDKGQRVYRLEDDYPAPDTIAFKNGNSRWIEVKHKTHASEYKNVWTVGMEKRYFNDYLQIEKDSGIPVHIFFLVDVSDNKTPFGMFEKGLKFLLKSIHSRSDDYLFWDVSKLSRINLY